MCMLLEEDEEGVKTVDLSGGMLALVNSIYFWHSNAQNLCSGIKSEVESNKIGTFQAIAFFSYIYQNTAKKKGKCC